MQKRWGIAAVGAIRRSFLSRLPGLRRHLGPVWSTSYQLASRVASSLRAGIPVREPGELQSADVLFLYAPAMPLSELIDSQFFTQIAWNDKIVLLAECQSDPLVEENLRRRGASVGVVASVPELLNSFVINGDRPAARQAKALIHSLNARPIEISQERLLLFQSALTLSGSLFTPLLETAIECLRQAGLDNPLAAGLTEALFQQSLRAFKRAGRKSWAGPVPQADLRTLDSQHRAIGQIRPMMAAYFQDAARYSFELYQTFPELTRYNKGRWKAFEKSQNHHSS